MNLTALGRFFFWLLYFHTSSHTTPCLSLNSRLRLSHDLSYDSLL